MKYLTKPILMKVARNGAKVGFSRQVGTDLVERLPSGAKFPVLASMLHDRVQGQRGRPHARTIIAVSDGETWQIDIDLDTFNDLPGISDDVDDVARKGT